MGKTALITGASSGIGYELARCFAAGGANLVLVARDVTTLNQIANELQTTFNVSAKVIPADLSRPVAPAEIHRETEGASLAVDYLVNDAGFGAGGPFLDTDLQTELDIGRHATWTGNSERHLLLTGGRDMESDHFPRAIPLSKRSHH